MDSQALNPRLVSFDSVAMFILESVEKAAMSLGKETVTPRLSLPLNNKCTVEALGDLSLDGQLFSQLPLSERHSHLCFPKCLSPNL